MVRREELNTLRATVTTTATTFGTAVAANMRRYAYYMKWINQHTAANTLTVQRRKGATVTMIEALYGSVAGETQEWPSGGPKEDSLPIYILPAGSKFRLGTDAGNAQIFVLYADGA